MYSRRCARVVMLICAVALAPATLLLTSSGAKEAHAASPGRAHAASLGSADTSGGLVVGLSEGASGWGRASTAIRLGKLRSATGAKWLRDAFLWSKIEPKPGKFDFRYYDHYMLLAAQRHFRIIALLNDAPRWAAPSPTAVPSDPNAYAEFVAAIVHRYGPNGTFWRTHPTLRGSALSVFELWNEPYYDNGNDGHYSPRAYARLVEAATAAGRAADPATEYLLEAEMVPHHTNVWTWWVDGLYRAAPNLSNYFDGVAVHDFGRYVRSLNPILYGKPYANFDHIRRIEDIRRQFIRHGAASKPFWIMETGWSTCTQRSVDCVTDRQQETNLKTVINLLHTGWKSWVQAAFIYRYQDGEHPNTVQDGYGLAHRNGSPKPALQVFRSFAATSP